MRYLPYLKEDRLFISQSLRNISPEFKIALMREYCDIWMDASKAEIKEHKKDNAGRFAANQFLLKSIEDIKTMKHKIEIEVVQMCGNCEKLSLNGVCTHHDDKVPEDYQNQENDCEAYVMGVPF